MRYYFDTSALCRYYHTEPGSTKVERIIDEPGAVHVLSWLTVLEAQSAFALKVRTSEITANDFALLRRRLKADIVRRLFLVTRLLRRHFDRAEQLLLKFGQQRRLRSLDALHLGIALDLFEGGHIDKLVAADRTVIEISHQEGLKTINPLDP